MLDPSTAQILAMALAHHRAGRLVEAEQLYRSVLRNAFDNGEALNGMGVLLLEKGQATVAATFLQKAITANQTSARYHSNLGQAYRCAGQIDAAVEACRRATQLDAKLAVAHNNLGIALTDAGQFAAAIEAFQAAIEVDGTYAHAFANLSVALRQAGQIKEAIAAAGKAIELRSDDAAGYNHHGAALAEANDYHGAVAAYRQAIALQPSYAEAYSNLGNSLANLGFFAEALATSRRGAELAPDSVAAHWNYAAALLRSGDLPAGFAEYEWRWRDFRGKSQRRFAQPHWNGKGDIAGKTILLHAEQGFGDTIHFARYVTVMAQRGARVLLECQSELAELMSTLPGIAAVIPRGEAVPQFDLHCPLMSLPLVLGTTLKTIPANVPYLKASPLSPGPAAFVATGVPNIGLRWFGNSTHSNDRNRSIPLCALLPLASVKANFQSLQPGLAATDLPAWIAPAPPLPSFAATAALIAGVDLVITVDTAVAHLAGAMAKPTWLLLPYLADWRWLATGSDSPWYPTMRLFRQSTPGQWKSVVDDVVAACLQFR